MVAELDMTDQDVTRIAETIDGEIAFLVPEWRLGPGIEETPRFANQSLCHNCASNHTSSGSFMCFLSNNLQCCKIGCAASMHGRFEEITFQAESAEHHATEDGLHYREICGQHEIPEGSSVGSGQSHSCGEYEKVEQSILLEYGNEVNMNNDNDDGLKAARNLIQNLSGSHSFSLKPSLYCDLSENYEKENQQELRWLKAKYQMELRELRDQQLRHPSTSSTCGNVEHKIENGFLTSPMNNGSPMEKSSAHVNKSCPTSETQRARNCEAMKDSSNAEDVVTAKSFYTGSLLPHSLHRTVSLPVDAVDI